MMGPEELYHEDTILRRDLFVLYQHQNGVADVNIAKTMRLSNSRVWQIRKRAEKRRKLGVI